MSTATYNGASLANVFQGMGSAPAKGRIHVDDVFTFGTTASITTPWIVRDETANTATFVQTAASEAGRFGTMTITPHASGGGRLCQPYANYILSASDFTFCEWWVKFVTGGSYFIGLQALVANQSATFSAGALTANGCGVLIQTDDKMDLVSYSGSANTAVTDVKTLTAGTWYRIGIRATTGLLEAYVDGRYVGRQVMSNAVTAALSPVISTGTTATKILTADLCAVGY
jgi:hypothetical protein